MRISDWSSDVCSSDLVLALHTDTPRPHVHLTVQAEGLDRNRFNPRPVQLNRFRERFARELRARGVAAEATPRRARGQGIAGSSMALVKLRSRLRTEGSRQITHSDQIGRAHVCTPVTNAHLVCCLLLSKKKKTIINT